MIRSREDRETLQAAAQVRARIRKEGKPARLARKRAVIESLAKGKREPREHDNGFLAWLRRQRCVACEILGGNCGPVQAAHLRFSDAARGRINSGLQQKPSDRWATPLGAGHHAEQHTGSERAFWDALGVDAGALCERFYAAYLAGQDAPPSVIRAGDRV